MEKNKNFRFPIIVGLVIATIFLLIFIGAFVSSIVSYNSYTRINHFSNIEICNMLDEYKTNNDVLSDKYIEKDKYNSSYTYELCYNDITFEIYAYEFQNIDIAKKYYSRVEGNTVDGEMDYNGNSNLLSSDLTVRYKTNVYRIETGNTKDYIEIMKFLNSFFDINIRK